MRVIMLASKIYQGILKKERGAIEAQTEGTHPLTAKSSKRIVWYNNQDNTDGLTP